MTTYERSALGAQPFLRGLPPGQLAILAELCRHVTVPPGQQLFEEDSRATGSEVPPVGSVLAGNRARGAGAPTSAWAA
jgi:hypothetical protein